MLRFVYKYNCYLGGVGTSQMEAFLDAGNTNGGSITVPMTSCLTGLESAV